MADTKTCKCRNCGATIDVETGKTYFNDGEIDPIAKLEKKVKQLAQLAGIKSRKKKGDNSDGAEKKPEGGGPGSEEAGPGFDPWPI